MAKTFRVAVPSPSFFSFLYFFPATKQKKTIARMSTAPEVTKRRRLRGSCDSCAGRKMKCDSMVVGPGNSCSNCVSFNTQCTHTRKRRHDDFSAARSLVSSLTSSKPYRLPNDPTQRYQQFLDLAAYIKELERETATLRKNISASNNTTPSSSTTSIPLYHPIGASLNREEVHHLENVNHHHVDPSPAVSGNQYFGPSSHPLLVRSAFQELDLDWRQPSNQNPLRRPEYWEIPHWDLTSSSPIPRYHFPEEDLLCSLVELYFIYFNPYFPILHKPTFIQSLSARLHEQNHRFGALVLAICALGARHSDDSRCYWNGTESLSAGWQWFSQVKINLYRSRMQEPVTVFELQTYIACSFYCHDTADHGWCWTSVGTAIRLAQDIGLHRTSIHDKASHEEWLRTYWTLILIDTIMATTLGRPSCTNPLDYDLEMISEVDDEYWHHPDSQYAFKQPPNQPSKMTYFVSLIQLLDILGFAQRTIYAIKKPGLELGHGESWTRNILSQLNHALDKWNQDLPLHLKWNPNQNDTIFFNQSAYLHATYCYIRIVVHRPFLPLKGIPITPFSLPSFMTCVESAKMCSGILEMQATRSSWLPFPHIQMALMTSGIILALSMNIGPQCGLKNDPNRDANDVRGIMVLFRQYEQRFSVSGRCYDMLNELMQSSKLEPANHVPIVQVQGTDLYNLYTIPAYELDSLGSRDGTDHQVGNYERWYMDQHEVIGQHGYISSSTSSNSSTPSLFSPQYL